MGKKSSLQPTSQGVGGGWPQDVDGAEQNVVEPLLLKKQRGKGSKRAKAAREVLQGAYEALWAMGNGGFLSHEQQKAIWPYLTWPPIPEWHILHLDDKADSTSLKHTVEPDDHTMKQALAGIFQPKRRVYAGQLYFSHLIIPVFFRHQERGSNVNIWGVIHVQKGKDVAYFHVLSKWQEVIHGANITAWAKSFDPQRLFGTRLKGFNLKVVVKAHNEDLDLRAFMREDDVEKWSTQALFYTIHAVRSLMLLGASDDQIPHFDLDENGPQGVVQLLMGISTAFEHAGLQVASEWPVSKMEEDEENALLYRQVCQEIRNAWGEDESEMPATPESCSISEGLEGTTIVDETSHDSVMWDEKQDDEMA